MKQVYCKKNFIGGNSTGSLVFTKGEKYECEDFTISRSSDKKIFIYDLRNRNSHYFGFNDFRRYFYTEQEVRKMKIKKLNERG